MKTPKLNIRRLLGCVVLGAILSTSLAIADPDAGGGDSGNYSCGTLPGSCPAGVVTGYECGSSCTLSSGCCQGMHITLWQTEDHVFYHYCKATDYECDLNTAHNWYNRCVDANQVPSDPPM